MIRVVLWFIPVAAFFAGWILGASQTSTAGAVGKRTPGTADAATAAGTAVSKSESPLTASPEDQAAALETALGYPSALRQLVAFTRLINRLDATGLAALHARLSGRMREIDPRLLSLFFHRWGNLAPQSAILATRDSDHLDTVLIGWAQKDPLAALAWADEQYPNYRDFRHRILRERIVVFAIPKPGEFPPIDAIRRINALPGMKERLPTIVNGIGAIMREWAEREPEAAWQAALTSDDLKLERHWALLTVMSAMAKRDPARCKEWIEALPDGPERTTATEHFTGCLVWKEGLDAGRAFALALPQGEARRHALANLAGSVLRKDPQGLGPFMAGLAPADLQDATLFRDVFTQWYLKDPERAGDALLGQLSSGQELTTSQRESLDHLFFEWTARDAKSAAVFSLKLPPAMRQERLADTTSSYTRRDAPAAAQWAAEISDPSLRDEVMAQVVTTWSSLSLPKVAEWLNSPAPGAAKPVAVETFARTFISTNPDDAVAWLRSLPNETDRLQRLNRVWNSWSDRQAAERWRETSPTLSPAERAALKTTN